MGDFGDGTGSSYDGDVKDTDSTPENTSQNTDWKKMNDACDTLVQMQEKLGVGLDGNKADLATRLNVSIDDDGKLKDLNAIQIVYDTDATVSAALSTNIPFDDTLPQQSTEGDLILSKAITPTYSTSILEIVAQIHVSAAAAEHITAALFKDSDEDAIAVATEYVSAGDKIVTLNLRYLVVSGSTAARTYKVHVGSAAQNVVINGIVTGPARRFGGVSVCSLRVTEWSTQMQLVYDTDAAVSAALTTNVPFDDTIPQNTDGDEILTQEITPIATDSIVEIVAQIHISAAVAEHITAALFQDTTANALAVATKYVGAADKIITLNLRHLVVSGSIVARTYKIRVGTASQNTVLNGIVTGPARKFGGGLISSLRVTEWQA
jgi:hypothetical protein